MARTLRSWIAICAFLLLANAPPQESLDPQAAIEIIGKAPPQIRREATNYVHQLGVASGDQPAGRWLDPVCPHAIGLNQAESALVEQQVRSIAQSVGAPVAISKCEANLLVVFTDDARDVARAVFRKLPLNSASIGDRKELETGDYPIRWWYSTDVRSRDGIPTGVMSPALRVETDGLESGTLAGVLPINENSKSISHPGSSIVSTQVLHAITHATVVIDVRRGATEKALASLVDYAAFVGLAEIRLGASPPNSILGLFGPEPNIGELTVTDHAFLAALYAMNLDRHAEQHRRVLIGQIIRERTAK